MTAPAATTADQQQAAQVGLTVVAASDLARAFPQLDARRLDATLPDFIRLVQAVIDRYGTAAATLAARFYLDMREAAGLGRFTVIPADPPGLAQIESAVRWAVQDLWTAGTDPQPSLQMVEGVSKNLIADVARNTIIDNARRDRRAKGWARIPEPTACSFCMLLATRGAVYKEQSVKFRAHQPRLVNGHTVGGVCQCHAEPVFTAYEPSARIREVQALYQSIPHGTPAEMRLAFRQAYEGRTPSTE